RSPSSSPLNGSLSVEIAATTFSRSFNCSAALLAGAFAASDVPNAPAAHVTVRLPRAKTDFDVGVHVTERWCRPVAGAVPGRAALPARAGTESTTKASQPLTLGLA